MDSCLHTMMSFLVKQRLFTYLGMKKGQRSVLFIVNTSPLEGWIVRGACRMVPHRIH